MVTVLNLTTQYAGLSSDTKPTDGARNGDSFFEMDTGDTYWYDADGKAWVKPNATDEETPAG